MPETREAIPERLYLNPNLMVLYAVTLTAIQGVSSITPAFPAIVREFSIEPKQVGLLITTFTLPGIVLTPSFGVLADRIGRKRVLVPALFLFAAAGVSCAFVRDWHLLLALRFFQGVGAASLGSLNMTIIGDLFSGRARTAAMGYNASVLSVGTASYPLIGGALASVAWYVPFFLPVLGVIVAMLVLCVLRNPEPRNRQTFRDYLAGAWRSVGNRNVLSLFLVTSLTFVILFGSYLTYFPLLVDMKFAQSSVVIGVLMASMSLTTATMSSQLGRLTGRFPENVLLPVAFVCYACALLLIPLMPGAWWLLAPTILFGLGHGVIIPTVLTLIAGASPPDQRAAVMSLNGMVLRVGQTLGPVIIGGAYSLWGLDSTFHTGAAIAGFLFLVTFIRGRGVFLSSVQRR
ncbi:MAG: Bacillibactin exporter [Calditrichaeota bacterium]|nr:Bacillibactin exporter [Calditrichota bacterium]